MHRALLILLLTCMTLYAGAQETTEETGGNSISHPFEFHTDDGCGHFYVSGIMTFRFNNGNGMDLISYEGAAVELSTGEETPLHVRSHGRFTDESMLFMTNGVFPGVMQFHYQMHIKFHPQFQMQVNDFSHCVGENNGKSN